MPPAEAPKAAPAKGKARAGDNHSVKVNTGKLDHLVDMACDGNARLARAHAELHPTPLLSALIQGIAFWAVGLDNALALGVFVGLVSQLIPNIGTIIGGALPVLVGLVQDPILGLYALIIVTIYQQIENYILAPPITAHTMDVHPAVAFGILLSTTRLKKVPGTEPLSMTLVYIYMTMIGASAVTTISPVNSVDSEISSMAIDVVSWALIRTLVSVLSR